MVEQTYIHLVGAPSSSIHLEDLGDDDLMRLVRTNRQDAFEVLVRRYHQLVLGIACRFMGDPLAGRDIAQDVFLALWAERERYQSRERFRSYLVSVALHRCQIVARQRRSHEKKTSEFSKDREVQQPVQDLPLERLVESARAQEVREKLAKLPEKMRQVLILRFTNDLPLHEIAEMTGMPLGSAKSQLFRGLRRLSRMLVEETP